MPIEVGKVYRCIICANKGKVLEARGGTLVCWGVLMK